MAFNHIVILFNYWLSLFAPLYTYLKFPNARIIVHKKISFKFDSLQNGQQTCLLHDMFQTHLIILDINIVSMYGDFIVAFLNDQKLFLKISCQVLQI
jgi:hypothetical protein